MLKDAGDAGIFDYHIHIACQGAARLRCHDRAKANGLYAGPTPLKGRRMASRADAVPGTFNLYAPETGRGSVWRAEDTEAKLAECLITEAAWREICDAKAAEEYEAWLASPETEAERFELLRAARDERLSATDDLVAPDYQLIDDALDALRPYHTPLRDQPAQEEHRGRKRRQYKRRRALARSYKWPEAKVSGYLYAALFLPAQEAGSAVNLQASRGLLPPPPVFAPKYAWGIP